MPGQQDLEVSGRLLLAEPLKAPMGERFYWSPLVGNTCLLTTNSILL